MAIRIRSGSARRARPKVSNKAMLKWPSFHEWIRSLVMKARKASMTQDEYCET